MAETNINIKGKRKFMSTKVSIMYGNDYHLYFDYEDFDYHLRFTTFGGKKEFTREVGILLEQCPLIGPGEFVNKECKPLKRFKKSGKLDLMEDNPRIRIFNPKNLLEPQTESNINLLKLGLINPKKRKMLKKEYQILKPFIQHPWEKLTFSQVKNTAGKKSESYVYNTLNRLVKEEILSKEKIGNISLYSLNINNIKSQSYTGLTAEYISWNKRGLPFERINILASKIPTTFFILLITGSYAKGQQKKGSDLDILIICDDSLDTKKIQSELHHDCRLSIPRIHLHVFTKTEYVGMLLDKSHNLGKEVANNSLILSGGQEYYRLMGEAISSGFSG